MDGFDNAEDRLHAQRCFEEVAPLLVDQLAHARRERSDLPVAGLIVESGTREWKLLRPKLVEATGQEYVEEGFAGVVHRDFVELLVAASGEDSCEVREWMEEVAPGDDRRRLPVLTVTRAGTQPGLIELEGSE